jgi:hypothetical protein
MNNRRSWEEMRIAGGLLVVFALTCSDFACAVELAPQKRDMTINGKEVFIPCIVSESLSDVAPQITRVVFSVHSSGFDAGQYFENAKIAASKVPGALNTTLIVAPQFLEESVLPPSIPDGLLYWRVSPYRGSSKASAGSSGTGIQTSAFDVMDNWLNEIAASKSLPNLKDIVLVGHSAGGQFVQRYAMVGKFLPPAGMNCRFVVSAPSSYAYPSSERYDPRSRTFRLPDAETRALCPDYDNWGYGLKEPYTYFSEASPEEIMKRYGERYVFYLCGARDNDPNDDTIGKSCGAHWQGSHRLDRMQIFHKFLEFKYGKSIKQRHLAAIVPGVPHHGLGTVTSAAGLKFLFSPLP